MRRRTARVRLVVTVSVVAGPRSGQGRRRPAAGYVLLGLLLVLALALGVRAPWRAEPASVPPRSGFAPSFDRDRAVLWAVGDGADGGPRAKAVVDVIRSDGYDGFLYLGDVYGPTISSAIRGDGTAADYRNRYASVYGGLAPRTAPTPGNHEWPQRDQGYRPYWARVRGQRPPDYYTFRAGGWQLYSLNSEAPHGKASAQVRWLASQLKPGGTCRLAFWHRPRFSGGKHGDQVDVAPLWDTFRGYGTLVINGHEHSMQRLHPIDGVTELVAGAGGHGRYALGPDRRRAFGDDRSYGALRIELRPGRATLTFVAAGGRLLDSSTVRCDP
jgi:hypothetical protein